MQRQVLPVSLPVLNCWNSLSMQLRKTSSGLGIPIVVTAVYVLFGLFILFAVQRVDPNRIYSRDSQSYQDSALALLEAHQFSVSPSDLNTPQTIRTPGYPAFIASIYAIFGFHPIYVILAQILLSAASLWLTYVITLRLWNQRAAIVAMMLVAIHLETIFLVQQILTETLFTFTVLCSTAILLTLLAGSRPRWIMALLMGFMIAVSTMIRPINYYFILLLLLFLLLFCIKVKIGWKSSALILLLTSLPSILLIGGWQLRNYRAFGSFEFSQIEGVNLLYYRAADILAIHNHTSIETARETITATHPGLGGITSIQNNDSYKQLGITIIKQYPWLLPLSISRGLAKMMLIPGENSLMEYLGLPVAKTGGVMGDLLKIPLTTYVNKWFLHYPLQFAVFFFAGIYLLVLYSGSLYGIFLAFRDQQAFFAHLFLLILIGYFLMISAGPEANARFLAPVIPFLAIYAGQSLQRLANSGWLRFNNK